jgi:hypothetical protein
VYDQNVDYKKMYFKMVSAMEDAIELLIKAQQDCEELYISAEAPKTLENPRKPIDKGK